MSIDIQLMNKREDGQWGIVCLPKEEVYNLGLATVKNKSGEYLEDPKTKSNVLITHQNDKELISFCIYHTTDAKWGMLEKLRELGQKIFPKLDVKLINDCDHYEEFWNLEHDQQKHYLINKNKEKTT